MHWATVSRHFATLLLANWLC